MASVGRLYAETLFEMEEEGALQICELRKALNLEYLSFFCSSLIPFSRKMAVLDQIPFSKTVKGFLYQLTLKNRWPYFEQICHCVEELVERKQKVIKGFLYTAHQLSAEGKKNIEQSIQKRFFKGKTILLEVRRKQELVYGFRVEVGGMSFDDSVLYHLKNFKAQVREYENK